MTERGEKESQPRDTYFASPTRASEEDLRRALEAATDNRIIDGLMFNVGGMIAVLNRERQILAVNAAFLDLTGTDKGAGELFGLRVGEAISCDFADDMPGGCGTGRFCSTCGAAIAIVSSQTENRAVERDCVAETTVDGVAHKLHLRIRSIPVEVEDIKLVLLFLRDTSEEQKRASIERAFHHDLGNIVCGIVGTADSLAEADPADIPRVSRDLSSLANRLSDEFKIQRLILDSDTGFYEPRLESIDLGEVLEGIERHFHYDQVGRGKVMKIEGEPITTVLSTDPSLLARILCNMVRNAFEASEVGDEIRVWVEEDPGATRLGVWNRAYIQEPVALRIFQRNFTTKKGAGRGLGTFSMKMLAEEFLNGRIEFTTSMSAGTTFILHLPANVVPPC